MDLEQVITDSVNDAQVDETPEAVEAPVADTPTEAPEAPVEASSEPAADTPAESPEIASPAAVASAEATPAEPQDEFAKLAGIQQMGVGGRENRIPYSRVKKITEKAVGDAVGEVAQAVLGRKLNPGEKAVDVVKAHVAKLPELEAKVTDYESRLESVGKFEDVMANDPQKFLGMLARIPVYKEFFDFVEQAYKAQQTGAPAAPAQGAQATPPVDPSSQMPEPDETYEDGSKVYSMDGLKKLLEWQSQQVESRLSSRYEDALKKIEERYKPIESEWQERRRVEATLPLIRKQIEEAKQWPLFSENEAEILAALQKDPSISLDRAYQTVVFPKLIADRNKVRQDVIREAQSAPTSTSVAARTATKPNPAATGPRSLEDIIRDSVDTHIKR